MDVSKLAINGASYEIKDITARSTADAASRKVEQLEQSMMSASYSAETETINFTKEG